MLLNMYEYPYALSRVYGDEPSLVFIELGLTNNENVQYSNVHQGSVAQTARESFNNKVFLIDQKNLALKNISGKIEGMSDSSIEILNLAYETAREAYRLRYDLELSVLNSQLKMIDIEILNLKDLTVDDFELKYGTV